jgi:hypothetical protein
LRSFSPSWRAFFYPWKWWTSCTDPSGTYLYCACPLRLLPTEAPYFVLLTNTGPFLVSTSCERCALRDHGQDDPVAEKKAKLAGISLAVLGTMLMTLSVVLDGKL